MEKPKNSRSLLDWPAEERPRERLYRLGLAALSDAELLAVVLRSGLPGQDVLQLSRALLEKYGGIRGLLAAERAALEKVRGLGPAKVSALLAVAELAKRHLREDLHGKVYVRDPQAVMQYLYASLRDLKREVFKAIFMDKGNRIVGEKDLFTGTVDEAAVHPREVVKAALDHHASSLVLVHNHPSGRVQPSPEDLEITKKIVKACGTVSVKVVDHIIVGDNRYFSFCEQGLMGYSEERG
ncbi:MAG: RadC family protein [Candidatus Omnitrophota bacterium]